MAESKMSDGSEFQVCGPKKTDVRTRTSVRVLGMFIRRRTGTADFTICVCVASQMQSSCCYWGCSMLSSSFFVLLIPLYH